MEWIIGSRQSFHKPHPLTRNPLNRSHAIGYLSGKNNNGKEKRHPFPPFAPFAPLPLYTM